MRDSNPALNNLFYYPELVAVALGIYIINAQMVEPVYTHFAMSVDDVVVFHHNPHVDDAAFFVVKKGKVAGFAFFNKAKRFALGSLLAGIAQQLVAV